MVSRKKDGYRSEMTFTLFIFIVGVIILLIGVSVYIHQFPLVENVSIMESHPTEIPLY